MNQEFNKKDDQKLNNFEPLNNPDHIDFEHETDEVVEKWGREKYDKWFNKSLSEHERKTLTSFIKDSIAINTFLEILQNDPKNSEKIKNFEKIFNLKSEVLMGKIHTIDEALKKTLTEQTMNTYHWVDKNYFDNKEIIIEENVIFQKIENKDTGDITDIKNFERNFKDRRYRISEYLMTSLNKKRILYAQEKANILLKIHVPKGIHAAYLRDVTERKDKRPSILIGREYNLRLKGISFHNELIPKQGVSKICVINTELLGAIIDK